MCRKKLTNKKGFTLAETLVATLIMLMVSAIMVAGIPSAKNAYDKIVLRSNAEVAMSTAISTLRSEMTLARNVNVEGNTVTYISGTYNTVSKISIDENTGELKYQRYYNGSEGSGEPLISRLASDELIIECTAITQPPDKGYIKFEGLGVCKEPKGNSIVKPENLSIITL